MPIYHYKNWLNHYKPIRHLCNKIYLTLYPNCKYNDIGYVGTESKNIAKKTWTIASTWTTLVIRQINNELQTNNATVDSSSTQRTTYRHAIFSLFSLLLTFTTTLGETLKFILVLMIRGGSRAAATFKMECFMIIVNGWIPLTII